MNCRYCGAENPEGAQDCASCGQPLNDQPTGSPAPPPPPLGDTYAPPPQQYAAAPPPPVTSQYAPPPGQPVAPPPQYGGYAPAPQVKSHLVMAILATLFCCMPLGVVAIVFASQVSSKLAVGDYPGAQRASKNAAMWSWIAIGAGLLVAVLYTVLIVLGVISDAGTQTLSTI